MKVSNILFVFLFAIFSVILTGCGGEDVSEPIVSEPEAPSVEQPGTEVPGDETPEQGNNPEVGQDMTPLTVCSEKVVNLLDNHPVWEYLPDPGAPRDRSLTFWPEAIMGQDGPICLIFGSDGEGINRFNGIEFPSSQINPDAPFPMETDDGQGLIRLDVYENSHGVLEMNIEIYEGETLVRDHVLLAVD